MSYPIAEVLGRVERRRRFSVEQKGCGAGGGNGARSEYVGGRAPARTEVLERSSENHQAARKMPGCDCT
jgi:hypothetical protein